MEAHEEIERERKTSKLRWKRVKWEEESKAKTKGCLMAVDREIKNIIGANGKHETTIKLGKKCCDERPIVKKRIRANVPSGSNLVNPRMKKESGDGRMTLLQHSYGTHAKSKLMEVVVDDLEQQHEELKEDVNQLKVQYAES
ncbi:hypothetical protein CR513_31071, partial [Mucuna pruriens]